MKKRLSIQLAAEPKETPKQLLLDVVLTLVGTFLFACSVRLFTAPNHIAPGGLTGVSTILNYITVGKLPLGVTNLCFNIPLILLGIWKLGKKFMLKTTLSLVSFTFFTDYLLVSIQPVTQNTLMAAIFGGLLLGAGLGILMSRGGSSGGSDILCKIIQQRLPHLKIGQVIFLFDLVVVTASIFAYREVEPALFALIALYLQSVALDKVLYGFNVCKFMYIVTEKADEMGKRINEELLRGATIFESYGSYTHERRPTLMVAVRQNEYYRLKKIISEVDPMAFVIVTGATEIQGKGFTKGMPRF